MSAFLFVMATQNMQVATQIKDNYTSTAVATIAKHGGKPLIRSTDITVLTGNHVSIVMVVEFPDSKAANAFWIDPEYEAVIHLREQVFNELSMYIIDQTK